MRSLRVKLIAPFIAGTLALTLLLAWYTYSSARQAVEDAMLLISEAKTDHASGSMSLLFKSMSSSLQNMVVDPHVTAMFEGGRDTVQARAKTADWLEIIIQGNEYYRDILIVDKSGFCVASSNPGHVGNLYIEKPYVREALRGAFIFGESSVGKVTKRFSAIAAGPVDAGGGIVGALIVFNDFPKIVDYESKATHDSQTIFTAMLDPQGLFTAHKDPALMDNVENTFPQLYEKLAAVGEKGGAVSYHLLDRQYTGYAKVEPNTHWVVVTSGIQSEVFAPAYRVGLTVFGISATFLCVISFMVVRFANGILSSLLSLIHYAKRVSEGDLSLRLDPTSRKDELGILHTALERLVASLQSMLKKTEEAGRMKGQFLANMSHEIRTPLNAIIGMTHLCAREGNLPEKTRGYLDKIQTAAKSLLGVINDILDLSKVEAGMLSMEHTPFSLRETLENTLDIHQDNARTRGIALSLDYPENVPAFFIGDPLRIGQVLNNLISNALKFTPHGSVTVFCRREQNASEAGGAVTIRCGVSDTGIGISGDALAGLFQPFTQADASITRKFGGTGLGLAISDRLVQMMGGSFHVESQPGKGTTFSFSMLLEPDASGVFGTSGEAPPDEAFERLGITGKRILVAEDNEINQLIVQELIAPSGAEVILVANGQEAVEAVRKEAFDLVLMDMQMPVMDGLEATRIIRSLDHGRNLPVIAVTANAMKEDKDRGFASGMNDYITKPIEPRELLQVLRAWLTTRAPR